MPRAKKDHACLNIKIDAALYRKLMEVSEEAGQTKTMVVERALQGYFNDYDAKQRILRQAEAGQLVPVGANTINGLTLQYTSANVDG